MFKNLLREKYFSNLSNDFPTNKLFNEKVKPSNLFNIDNVSTNKEFKFKTKRRGRKNKVPLNTETQNIISTDMTNNVHNKYSHDNIKRRIKALFNNYIIRLLNNLIKQKYLNSRHYFLKMNIKVTKDLGIEYNRNLLNTPLKEIIVNISNKYQNKENNNIKCIKFIEEQKDNEEIINILNMTYEQLYINYLNTTKNDSQENSFEAHKEKMLKVYGKEYLDKFIENTKNFIEYFKKGKNRKSRKPPEVDIINIPLEFNKNNIIEDNKIEKIMVESFAQTDLCGINSKLIAFY